MKQQKHSRSLTIVLALVLSMTLLFSMGTGALAAEGSPETTPQASPQETNLSASLQDLFDAIGESDESLAGNLYFKADETGRALLYSVLSHYEEELGIDLENLSWFEEISMDYLLGGEGKNLAGDLTLNLNEEKIISLNAVLSLSEEILAVSVPELSTLSFKVDMAEYIDEMQSALNTSAAESDYQISFTDEEKQALIERYAPIFAEYFSELQTGEASVTAGGVTESCVSKAVSLGKTELEDLIMDLAEALWDDEVMLEKIAEAAASQSGETPETIRREIKSMLSGFTKDDLGLPEDISLDFTQYQSVDEGFRGLETELRAEGESFKAALLIPRDGEGFGFALLMSFADTELFSLSGSGEMEEEETEAELRLRVSDKDIMDVTLDAEHEESGFDTKIYLKPTAQLLRELMSSNGMSGPKSFIAASMMKNFSFRLRFVGGQSFLAELALVNAEDEVMALGLVAESEQSKPIQMPTVLIEPDVWAETINEDRVQAVLDSIIGAGVPQNLIEAAFYAVSAE